MIQSATKPMIEAREKRVTWSGTGHVAVTMSWVREDSIDHDPHEPDGEHDWAEGWLIVGLPRPRAADLAAVSFERMHGEWVAREYYRLTTTHTVHSDFSANELITSPGQTNKISLADVIAFERMWPTFIALLNGKQCKYTERKVTP